MMRLVCLCILFLAMSGWGKSCSKSAIGDERERPNIVFILADDMGYGDLAAFHPDCQIATPNLDGLAKSGVCFTDAHSGGSLCQPSRYSLLTGRFAARRKTFNDRVGPIIAEGRITIAEMLRNRGYRTSMVGKWHLGFDQLAKNRSSDPKAFGFDFDQPLTGGPLDRGFDTFFGMHASLDIPPYFYIQDRAPVAAPTETIANRTSVGGTEGWNHIQGEFWRGGKISPDFEHEKVTPRFTSHACQLIESHDQAKPLFLYLALPSPHTPWLPSPQFAGKSAVGSYGDFVMMVDDVVGQVLASLEKSGMNDNTLVMFSSDNGPVWYEKDVIKYGHRSTGVLRGCKASVWEGGHRVPFIARWPGKIASGTRSDHLIAFADVYATLAEVAGMKHLAKGAAEDSESFLSAMLHPEIAQKPRGPILHGEQTIRSGDWKLINTKRKRGFNADRSIRYGVELYNLKDDILESKNLVRERPEKVALLKRELASVLERPGSESPIASDEWITLFNGKDLSGWRANVDPDSWSVEQGAIKAHAKRPYSHLFFVGDSRGGDFPRFKDFVLELEVKTKPKSNGGIFFHTDFTSQGKRNRLIHGHEVQICSTKKEKRKTGSLYKIEDLAKSPVDETEWFRVQVTVRDSHVTIKINDQVVVDYAEPRDGSGKLRLSQQGGAIAFQAHDPDSVVFYRAVRIKKLD